MANLKEVRTRIASVSSTQQITSAMKMVSAAKFRRAQNAIIGMRPYAASLQEIISDIGEGQGTLTPFHAVRPVHNVVIVVVTSNKGLCGAFNSNVIKLAQQRIEHWHGEGAAVRLACMGKKASEFFSRQKNHSVTSYDEFLDAPSFDTIAGLADSLMADFAAKGIDRVEVVYNKFKNSLTQIITCEQWLPVNTHPNPSQEGMTGVGGSIPSSGGVAEGRGGSFNNDYIYEPSQEEILREMIPLTLRSTFYRMVLDSLAAEHGARMNAMQKATDNATELLKDLRLSYNKARQANITNEIIEIVSGSEALKG